jgi:hypothetical protein
MAMRRSLAEAPPVDDAPPRTQRLLLVARGSASLRWGGSEVELRAGEFIRLDAADEVALATSSQAEVIQITGRLEGDLTVETIELERSRAQTLRAEV